MGLFNKSEFSQFLETAKKEAKKISDKTVETYKDVSASTKEQNEIRKKENAPLEGAFVKYKVIYLGGIEGLTKSIYNMGLNIMEDRFVLKPDHASLGKIETLEIPYESVEELKIVKRTLSTAELLLTNDAKGLDQENNIEIRYINPQTRHEIVLRLEMLTGLTPASQAGSCREMMDLLRQKRILKRIEEHSKEIKKPSAASNYLDDLAKLAELKNQGIITEEEFQLQKQKIMNE